VEKEMTVTGPEKTLPVELTLEESGILCHLMMGQKEFRDAALSGETRNPVIARCFLLYKKLADCNDKLMGKKI
jgi:hypothetical protein